MSDVPNYNDVYAAVGAANSIKSTYLSKRGWTYSSDFPDSRWRYSKEIDGRVLAMNLDDALSIQAALDDPV